MCLSEREIIEEINKLGRVWTVRLINMEVEVTIYNNFRIRCCKVFKKSGEFRDEIMNRGRRFTINSKKDEGER